MGANFSWKQTTFAGFGVLRREPRLLLILTPVGLVFTLGEQVVAVNADIIRSISATSPYPPLLNFVSGVISLATLAIVSAAAYRAVLEPADGRSRVRFSGDEVRLALAWLAQLLLLLVPVMASTLLTAIVTAGTIGRGGIAASLLTILAFAVGAVLSLLLFARLSLSGPMVVAEGAWTLGAAWRLTRGRAWKISAVHLVALLMSGGGYWVWRALYGLAVQALGGQFSIRPVPAGTSIAALFEPWQLTFTVLTAGLNAVGALVMYAPAAAIYRDLAGLGPTDQAAVFD